jgi:hypothetical protein
MLFIRQIVTTSTGWLLILIHPSVCMTSLIFWDTDWLTFLHSVRLSIWVRSGTEYELLSIWGDGVRISGNGFISGWWSRLRIFSLGLSGNPNLNINSGTDAVRPGTWLKIAEWRMCASWLKLPEWRIFGLPDSGSLLSGIRLFG